MLREYAVIWRSFFILLDLAISTGAFLAAYWLRFQPWIPQALTPIHEKPPVEAYIKVIPFLCALVFFTNSFFRLYHPRRVSSFLDELRDILKSSAVAVLFLMTFFFFNRTFAYSRLILLLFFGFNVAAVFLLRLFIRSLLRWLRSKGYNLRTVLIIGTGRCAQALLCRFHRNPWTGMRVAGLVSLSPGGAGREIHGVPILGSVEDMERILEAHEINQAFVAVPLERHLLLERLIEQLSEKFVAVRLVPDLGFLLTNRNMTDFDGLSVVNLWENHLSGWNAFFKRLLDLTVALAALVLLSPLLLAVGIAVKLTSRGPVFYVQKRMGHDGRIFPMLKFRTMKEGSEDDTRFTKPGDERCTSIGRILRRTSLDEVPQLFNVIAGQMSLVGPRPERPVFIEKFRKAYPQYMMRHKLKAGMTGWAQVNGWRGDTSLRKRLQYDLYYLHNWSMWFDLKIIFMTLFPGSLQRNAY